MFDIGFGEMILLAAIALIAIGPKQLPEVARVIGRMLNEFRRATGDLTRTFVEARDSTQQALEDAHRAAHQPVPPNQDPAVVHPTQPSPESHSNVENQMAFNLSEATGTEPAPVVPPAAPTDIQTNSETNGKES